MKPERRSRKGLIRSGNRTLVKVPRTAAIAFGLKTYLWPMRDMLADPDVRSALEVAAQRTWPETREYMKGRHEVLTALLGTPAESNAPSSPAGRAVPQVPPT